MIQNGKRVPTCPASEGIHAGSPADAVRIQEMLRHHCIVGRTIDIGEIRRVAGADAAYDGELVYAAIVVLTVPGLEVVEKTCAVCRVPFPYIPGLFSFREGPAILEAFGTLTAIPDLMIIHGHGYAHLRRFGIASHIGVLLDVPSIGVVRHLLTGTAPSPATGRGSSEPVRERNEVIGRAVRTVEGSKPVFVSVGHKVDLDQAVAMVLKTTVTHGITEPLWQADRLSRQCRDKHHGAYVPQI